MEGYENIKSFFTESEWINLSNIEKKRYSNMYDMYKQCLHQGIEIPKPNFMEENKENVDENISGTKEKKKKKRVRFRLSPKIFPKRNLAPVNYKENDVAAKDSYIYCDECQEEFENYCPTCGMLVHIFDKNVRKGVKDRARKTLPSNLLEIKESSIHGEGVFTLKTIPAGVKFGPYVGLEAVQSTSGYAWKLVNGKLLDAVDVEYSNWMRYVNCARHVQEQNLVAFHYEGNLYYRSFKEIKKGDELLVFYGEKFAKILNIDIKKYFEPISENLSNTYACFPCCLGFSNEKFLKKHMTKCPHKIIKQSSCEGIVPCPFCKIYLSNKTYLEDHVKYCRAKFKTAPSELENDFQGKNCFNLMKKYNCTHCQYKTNDRSNFLQHTRVHEGTKPFRCSICSKTFSQKGNLKTHIRVHTDEKPFECNHCQRRFNEKGSLLRHVRYKHSNERKFACNYCSYTSVRNQNLKDHIKIHTKLDTFNCEICDKTCITKSHLKVHLNKHLDIKFECSICEYSSHYKSNLNRHYRRKHSKQLT